MEEHSLLLRIQQNLTVVVEVHLENLVAQPEHNCVAGFQPLLYVHEFVVLVVNHLVLQSGNRYLGQLSNFVIQVNNKSFKEHIFFLEVSIFW